MSTCCLPSMATDLPSRIPPMPGPWELLQLVPRHCLLPMAVHRPLLPSMPASCLMAVKLLLQVAVGPQPIAVHCILKPATAARYPQMGITAQQLVDATIPPPEVQEETTHLLHTQCQSLPEPKRALTIAHTPFPPAHHPGTTLLTALPEDTLTLRPQRPCRPRQGAWTTISTELS